MKYFLFFLFFINIKSYPFQIEVVNITDKKASVYIVVFDHKDGFPFKGEKGIFKWKGTPAEAEKGVSTGLPDGNYAVAVFQDTDGNGELTKWFFGKPREPYGLLGAVEKPKKKPDFSENSKKISRDSVLQIRLWEP
ncbi:MULTISPECIES: DUF2141 domain-containing protein [Psychrilyobacter]|uniref:DUF2141 domain-containing protein n=1 Tax=Psychrilyobacter piezotolerans TaxID=2293438 RepID=A0ABX9KJV2_9FUSO|nr:MULTISPECIES: DUF2141 domain-containing protein [Psychrilyobacter]MCS5421744.1 DUF2141 domain-containing protein [Psychrilyobacter sp. S5]NDI77049.1 DUF2141 domain-containing protein [Psychrilyobacter piezotolerans]RDE64666.1 DUF2141 domain-containing protein [Psychrilyobacter sp. S5]REI42478.1 DUF2141 domain-containing protein [Psychrilyobacter piezotolerans]